GEASVACSGPVARGCRRHWRCRDTCGLLPNGFVIWRRVVGPRRLAIPQRMRGAAVVPISSTFVPLGPGFLVRRGLAEPEQQAGSRFQRLILHVLSPPRQKAGGGFVG